ncbi:hypothetical protein VC82_1613 [Flagellimonas lutaonensis]|uniref:Uncharacterized protein n=1 Tax=Flagellimonas lutaonensis TaxID=516051 RepID=A0A0D5YSJ4_9FLAO|nr:hypothetical protein VC82_1613 [Allomuricauda lutaonensis]
MTGSSRPVPIIIGIRRGALTLTVRASWYKTNLLFLTKADKVFNHVIVKCKLQQLCQKTNPPVCLYWEI